MNEIFEMMGIMLFLATASILIKKKRTRRFKIRPMNRRRNIIGIYHNMFKYSQQHDKEQFFKYTRMSPEMFQYVLELIRPYIQRQPKVDTITPEQRLSITLHYLSQGSSMQEAAWNNFIGKTTASTIINETCLVLWHILCPLVMPVPSKENYKSISREFFLRWNMPNCIGAVDGKLISMQNPAHGGSRFFSYKKTYSIILMATCDAYYRFTMVDVGTPGSEGDSHTFRESEFGKRLLNGSLNLPKEATLPGTNIKLPYFLVADQAFPLHKNIMRPYPGQYLSEEKNIFNLRLSRARRTIENSFGILVQRWRILRGTIIANEDHVINIVKACLVLHNLLQKGEEELAIEERRYCPTGFADGVDPEGNIIEGSWRQNSHLLKSLRRLGANNASNTSFRNRENLMGYFLSDEGAMPHQWDAVQAGGIP